MPTVEQLDNFPEYADAGRDKFPQYADHMMRLHASRREVIGAAYEAGVAIYAGTDAGGVLPHGLIGEEVVELATYGLTPADALGAASWRARDLARPRRQPRGGHHRGLRGLRRQPARRPDACWRGRARVVLRGAVVA